MDSQHRVGYGRRPWILQGARLLQATGEEEGPATDISETYGDATGPNSLGQDMSSSMRLGTWNVRTLYPAWKLHCAIREMRWFKTLWLLQEERAL